MSRKNNLFKQVPVQNVRRNYFDLSHEHKASYKFGNLYPFLLMEVLPGDIVEDTASVFARFAPMLAPIMHRVDVTTHFFKVPNRIITDHWEDFITTGPQGNSTKVLPYLRPDSIAAAGGGAGADSMRKGTLWDHFGLPLAPATPAGGWTNERISVLPFRAMAKIWNDYYRDPNITPSTELELNEELEGNVSTQTYDAGLLEIYQRGWAKDYFTSALPWAQRGPEVLMPLAGSGSVSYLDQSIVRRTSDGGAATGDLLLGITDPPVNNVGGTEIKADAASSGTSVYIDNIEGVELDESAVSINDLRSALAMQRWMENNARGGGRYVEQIEAHFNVRVPDYRLQRAEYLGGGKQPVQISEVLATANTDVSGNEVPVGDMYGHGISFGKTNRFNYMCKEHGWIIGVISFMPVASYDLGIERKWSREAWYDFAFPELAHLGEQEIKSKELFFSFDATESGDNQDTFGYIPRYSEYKFMQDRFVGDFRSNLLFWHLGRKFLSRPVLDDAFLSMEENGAGEETFRRIFAVQDGTDYIWCQIFHRLSARRPLPYFGVPKLIG